MMGTGVVIDGVRVDSSLASVPITDRGFLYGDSAFEVTRTYGGRPFALRAHVERLRASCELLRFELDVADAVVVAEVHAALRAAGNPECYVRVVVTRGDGAGLSTRAGRARRVVVAMPLPPQPAAIYADGVQLSTVRGGRALDGTGASGAKASNYLPNILSLSEAQARGSYEALMVGANGEVLEGATSNVFVVRGGRVRTPATALGILDGITRRAVFAVAARSGVSVREGLLFPSDLYGADELFITSSLRELVPVIGVDGARIGDGRPGQVYRRLHAAFRAHAKEAEAEPGPTPER